MPAVVFTRPKFSHDKNNLNMLNLTAFGVILNWTKAIATVVIWAQSNTLNGHILLILSKHVGHLTAAYTPHQIQAGIAPEVNLREKNLCMPIIISSLAFEAKGSSIPACDFCL